MLVTDSSGGSYGRRSMSHCLPELDNPWREIKSVLILWGTSLGCYVRVERSARLERVGYDQVS